ncbi:hypothetical protein L1049_024796 [Liquidambar formosana]|uniref:Uncharacterized protein n=1 Tax=Liquidambar formosana TaxID=63359 RepID=A0AAP0S173_LIQFO
MTRFDLKQASGIIVLNFPEPVIPMPSLFSVYDLLSIFTQTYTCNSLIGPQEVEPQYKKHLDMDQAGDKIMRDLIAQIHSPPSIKEPPISTRAQRVKPILAKDDLDTLFARMEVAVSSATITSTSHTGSGVVEQTSGGTEEIEQAKAVLERCLALEFSQIFESKVKAQFILALSVLSSATSEFSSAQNESIHRLWGQNTLTLNLHHSQKEFAECNKFLDRKDVLYDELKKFNDSNSTIMAQLQKLSAEKEQLMTKLTEIEATQAKLMENRKQLGEQAKTTMADWKQLNNDSAEMNMRKKIAEDHILQVSTVWSSFKVLFPLV